MSWLRLKFDPDQSLFVSLLVMEEEEGQKNCQTWLQKECQKTWCRRCQTRRELTNSDMLGFRLGFLRTSQVPHHCSLNMSHCTLQGSSTLTFILRPDARKVSGINQGESMCSVPSINDAKPHRSLFVPRFIVDQLQNGPRPFK